MAPLPEPRRGEVWLAHLDKTRPVVVLTRDPMGQFLNSVIVAPVTSTVRGLSTEVALDLADGVRAKSVANLDNVQLVDRSLLARRVGHVRVSSLTDICMALRIAVGCG
jgi:mRNA interferase MazF